MTMINDDVQKPVFRTKSQRQRPHDFLTDPPHSSFKKPRFSLSVVGSSPVPTPAPMKKIHAEINTNSEGDHLDAIKTHYLGGIKPKKRSMKPFTGSRFSFDWENDDDTSCADANNLSCEVRPLFGRGFRGGIDRREQKKKSRETNLEGFRTKRFVVLVTTDVLGRGIDIPHVAHVINYDMPGDIQVYTHRIGRTGRAGKRGKATTFLTMHDEGVFYDLKLKLSENGCPVPPELSRHEASESKPGSILQRLPRC
ncbi:hypothetical protein ACLOJK_030588 [Asimina triloba]